MNKYNILVTGCGGDIGQSIGKILLESDLVANLYGIDISDKNAGRFIYKNFSLGLRYSDPAYLKSLEGFIERNSIDILIPIAEPELRFFALKGIIDNVGKARIISASIDAMKIGFDKYLTATFLKNSGLPYPETQELLAGIRVDQFPVIVKAKTGSGSAQVNKVTDQRQLDYFIQSGGGLIVQQYIDGSEGEFTCGVFRSAAGETRTIIFKRELIGGFSGYGEVVADREMEDLLDRIAVSLNLTGSINVQLRKKNGISYVFEINPRFSSTVRFRDLFGFKDVIWSVEDRLGLRISDYKETSVGRKFYKGFCEYIS